MGLVRRVIQLILVKTLVSLLSTEKIVILKKMRNYLGSIGRLALVIFAILIGIHLYSLYGAALPISQTVTQKQDIFSVSGEGKVTTVPNTAVLSLGVIAEASTVVAAQTQANMVMESLSKQLQDLRVADVDIKTTEYNIYPQYGQITIDRQQPRISGYQVNVSLEVNVRNLDILNSVIDTATSVGANQVGGIQLTVDDKTKKDLLKQAQKIAVSDAKEKAESLASAAGVTLGRVINIQESGQFPSTPMFRGELDSAIVKSGVPTQIEVGSTELVTQVTLYYEIR